MNLSFDPSELLALLADLVRIESVNPALEAGGSGEAKIAAYSAEWLRAAGLEVDVHEGSAGRPSVLGRLAGSGSGRSLMLNAHMDTVGIAGMDEPLSGDVRDGRLYGRGSYDMKGGLAAIMMAGKVLAASGTPLPGSLLVAGVADEEVASGGTMEILAAVGEGRYGTVDGAIVTEPTQLELCLAHKGFVWLEIEVSGRAAHGSQFTLGVDANMCMGRVLAEVAKLEEELRLRPGHALVGPPSLHAATLQGGTALSVYAARSTLGIERRTVPGETEERVTAEIEAILHRLRAADPTLEVDYRVLLSRPPFAAELTDPIVSAVEGAAAEVLGRPPQRVGENPWMDSALLADAGIETVVIGPAGTGAHSAEEWVDVDSVVRLTEVLVRSARTYCAG